MAIIDNTLASRVETFDPATPLKQAAALQAAEMDQRQQQFKLVQAEVGAEARGLQAYVNSPEFPQRWAEGVDRLAQKGVLPPQVAQEWRSKPSPLMLKSLIQQTEDPALSFRKQEAVREQGNTDRTAGLQAREMDIRERTLNRDPESVRTLRAAGIEPTSPEGRAALFPKADDSQVGEIYDPVTGQPQKAIINPRTRETTPIGGVKKDEKKNDLETVVEQRKKVAASLNITPDNPAYNGFVATGKMPREDAQDLTATDKKAILEADELVLSNQSAIDSLKRAKDLSPKAFAGPGAGKVGYLASFLGEDSDWGKSGIATENLNNEVMTNALGQLKAIFGGAPTEGERKILVELQGSVSKSDAVRREIFERAMGLAEKRLEFNKQRADGLRNRNYYKPTSGAKPSSSAEIPAAAIEALRSNPSLKADFEAKYGAGSAAAVLK